MDKLFLVQTAQAILQEEYAYLESLEELAFRLELHPAYFSRLFKEKTGLSPQQYLNDVRLEAACKLLLSSPSLSNEEIAQLCGYANANYFAKVFRKKKHLSPKKWQEISLSTLPKTMKIKKKVKEESLRLESLWL